MNNASSIIKESLPDGYTAQLTQAEIIKPFSDE